MLYLIAYELNKNKDYTALYEAMKNYGTWWHYLDSVWIIKTNHNSKKIYDNLSPYLDKVSDNLLIIKIDPQSKSGWLNKKAWKWIKRNQ